MDVSSPVDDQLEIDLPEATITLVNSDTELVVVSSTRHVRIAQKLIGRGRVIRWSSGTAPQSGGSIRISNTGPATATGGGIANTGYIGGRGGQTAPSDSVVTIKVPARIKRVTIKKAAHYTIDPGLKSSVSDNRR
ncbi:MAG: hypothetical protein JWP06_970 [Candidatus Saccharibacteria bacterium]|nr:hypothetical protein [Candidatus Saccharibacteria bacterium]